MNAGEFDKIVSERIDKIKNTLGSKAKEYAMGDRLYNFKRAAEIARITPRSALTGMMMKHLVSVLDLVDGKLPCTAYYIDEKIGDLINYLILLEAMLTEEGAQTKRETVVK